jgi:hypothetical protein
MSTVRLGFFSWRGVSRFPVLWFSMAIKAKKIKGRRRGGLFAERGVHTSGLAASQWYVRDASEHGTVRAT